ncbi:MAG TPA: ABC transporter permease subunit [Candidatus Limnocylindria bacterium]|nr:ABC transporter permease subunit [Candidatus Limnocylindria bacterium]
MIPTLVRLALRAHRLGLVLSTIVALLFALGNVFGYAQISGDTPQERAVFARQMEILGRQLSYFLPLPSELETLSGYLQWRHFGSLPIVYAFWALIAGSGAGRGDEERGLVPQWLAAGVPRLVYLASRVAAFAILCALSIAAMSAALILSSRAVDEPVAAGSVARQAVALLAFAVACFGVGLLVAQITGTRRASIGFGGALLLALFMWNSWARTNGAQDGVALVSPFALYERSQPLYSTGSLDVPSVVAMLLAGIALVAMSALAFARRDVGEALLRTRRAGTVSREPSRDPLLRLPVLASIDQQRLSILGWAVGLSIVSVFFISLTRTIVDQLQNASPVLRSFFERAGISAYDTFVGVIWGSTILLLLSLYAIAQVNAWVSEEADGRLDTVLAQPVSRTRVVLERIAAVLVAGSVIVAVVAVVGTAAASSVGIELDRSRVATAAALLVAVILAFAGIGALLAAWKPRAAVPVLALVAIYSYFVDQFAPLFEWPEWIGDATIYGLFGAPFSEDVPLWPGPISLVAIAVLGTVLATAAMRRRDVGR